MFALNSQFTIREGSLINWIPDAFQIPQVPSNQNASSTGETFMRWSCCLRYGCLHNSFGSHNQFNRNTTAQLLSFYATMTKCQKQNTSPLSMLQMAAERSTSLDRRSNLRRSLYKRSDTFRVEESISFKHCNVIETTMFFSNIANIFFF